MCLLMMLRLHEREVACMYDCIDNPSHPPSFLFPPLSLSLCIYIYISIHRRKFRSQTSDNMDRWKAEMGRVREKRRVEERRSEKRKSQKKEDADARKGRKVTKHCVFPMFVAPEGRKVGSLKRRVRSHLARWEMKNYTPLWPEAHFEVKM